MHFCGKELELKNNDPDRGLLLISLIMTVLATIIAGLILSADSTDPIKTVMMYVHDGFTVLPDTGGEMLENDDTTEPEFIAPPPPPDDTTDEVPLPPETTLSPDTTREPDVTTSPDVTTPPEATARPEDTTRPVETDPPETKPPEITTKPPVSDEEYFSNTLFIGDSRTAGFYLYAKIPNATYFGTTSMSVFSIFSANTKSETGVTKGKGLVTVLSENQYKQIYILLGINEVGYSLSKVADTYSEVLDYIMQYQPEAKIIIQSNMHVTKEKSDTQERLWNESKKGSRITNARIDELNLRVSKLADNKKVFYLDFVAVFDDSSGAMDPTYSGDGVHLYGKCYKAWRDWILENGKIY